VVSEADLLLIVMDGSSAWSDHQLETVNEVLDDLAAHETPRLLVFNKMDLVTDAFERKRLSVAFPHAIFVSALSEADMQQLKRTIAETIKAFKKEKAMSDIIAHTTKEFNKEME